MLSQSMKVTPMIGHESHAHDRPWKSRSWSAIELTPMIGIDPHSGYSLFWALPDLTTEVNSFDDLNKIGNFY